jgi:hypothetical protein
VACTHHGEVAKESEAFVEPRLDKPATVRTNIASFATHPRGSKAAVKVMKIVIPAFHDPLTVAVNQSPLSTKLNTGATFYEESYRFILRSCDKDALGVYETIPPIDTSSGATRPECRRVCTIESSRYDKFGLVIDVTPSLIFEDRS